MERTKLDCFFLCIVTLNVYKHTYIHTGDDEGDEKLTLALLCALLVKKGTPAPLAYIYEQCQVNNPYMVLMYCPGNKTCIYV